ncbi:MAG TPA: lytic transglycosylase domain-containing protein, partial [Azospirillaceae bacterium]|nr:lytic transglycosylase domain-containing protein [Azospirillaceae bacterium]
PQTQVAQGTTTQVASAPLPDRKPVPPATQVAQGQTTSPALLAATEAPTRNGTRANAEERIKAASRQVAGLSGHSYRTILAQATQESGLNPHAKSKTSSAAGPFQFLERTWLDMFRRHGAAYGMGDLADKIQVRDGVPTVKDPAVRKQILDLRHDVDISAGMAARLLSEGRGRLEQRLKRPVTETESRLAYVFGVGGALTLIRGAEKNPDKPAAELLPGAAKANGPLFYDRKTGQALSVAETLQRLQRKMNVDQRDMFAAIDDASGRLRLDGGASPFGAFQTATDMAPPSPLDDAESVAGDGKPV